MRGGFRTEIIQNTARFCTNNRPLTAELIVATRKGSWDSETLNIDAALNTIIDPRSHDFGGGVLDALISSGRLEIISNYDLRVRLANWSQVFGEIRDGEIRNAEFIMHHVFPYMLRWHIPQSRAIELCCTWAILRSNTRLRCSNRCKQTSRIAFSATNRSFGPRSAL